MMLIYKQARCSSRLKGSALLVEWVLGGVDAFYVIIIILERGASLGVRNSRDGSYVNVKMALFVLLALFSP